MAAAQVGNESLTDAVHERTTKKDGNAARTRVGVNISEVCLFDLCRIEGQYLFGLIVTDINAVYFVKLPLNFEIANMVYVASINRTFHNVCGKITDAVELITDISFHIL